jgi:hypothetical protein
MRNTRALLTTVLEVHSGSISQSGETRGWARLQVESHIHESKGNQQFGRSPNDIESLHAAMETFHSECLSRLIKA